MTAETLIEWGVATRIFSGQAVSGDQYVVQSFVGGTLVAVVDGLGHGEEAANAAKLTLATLEAFAHQSVIPLVRRCHETLLQTRGVVMSVASFNEMDETMTWLGVGNVAGVLIRADSSTQENLLLRGGVVGYQLPPLIAAVLPLLPGDTLIFATDGLHSYFTEGVFLADAPQRLAERVMAQHGKGTDDALVLVARWLGKKGGAPPA